MLLTRSRLPSWSGGWHEDRSGLAISRRPGAGGRPPTAARPPTEAPYRDPEVVVPNGTGDAEHLQPSVRRAVDKAIAAAAADGVALRVTSGYRSRAKQQRLYDEAIGKYGSAERARRWVLPPGESEHVQGRAVDVVPRAAPAGWSARACASGCAGATTTSPGTSSGWRGPRARSARRGSRTPDGQPLVVTAARICRIGPEETVTFATAVALTITPVAVTRARRCSRVAVGRRRLSRGDRGRAARAPGPDGHRATGAGVEHLVPRAAGAAEQRHRRRPSPT